MSINLYSFVENPFTPDAYFNYDKFIDVTYKAQRLMDDVIDLEEEKINLILNKIENDPEKPEYKIVEKNLWIKIKEKLLQGRRTGLSAIGLADALAAIGIIYGSDDSFVVIDEIYKQFAISAYKSSIDIAEERGAFPIWDLDKEKNNPFLNRIFEEEDPEYNFRLFDKYYSYGRRNIALLTIPPSGTISLLSGLSSGIEPVYQLSYKRRRKVDKDHPKASFMDKNRDWWEEYVVLHPKFKEWARINNVLSQDNINLDDNALKKYSELSPYHGATAYELNPIDRVKLQGIIQQWIDHSISSTLNLPKEATEEDVANIYMKAWRHGLKGVTVYRDGSRDGVLISNDEKKSDRLSLHDATKRPKVLNCDVHYTSIQGVSWMILVGLMNSSPYEVFAFKSPKNGLKLDSNDKYVLVKEKSKFYSLVLIKNGEEKVIIENIIDYFESPEEEFITRLISTSLRHGTDISFIYEQLVKSKGFVTDFSKSMARIFKKYINNDIVNKKGETCPECGAPVAFVNGCLSCSCGWSKCS